MRYTDIMRYTDMDLCAYLEDRCEGMSDTLCEIGYPIPLNGSLFEEGDADPQVIACLQQARTNLGAAIYNLQAIGEYIRCKEKQEI